MGDPNFFLQISFSWVKMSFHVEFHLPGLPGSALKVFGRWVLKVILVFSLGLSQAEQFAHYSILERGPPLVFA